MGRIGCDCDRDVRFGVRRCADRPADSLPDTRLRGRRSRRPGRGLGIRRAATGRGRSGPDTARCKRVPVRISRDCLVAGGDSRRGGCPLRTLRARTWRVGGRRSRTPRRNAVLDRSVRLVRCRACLHLVRGRDGCGLLVVRPQSRLARGHPRGPRHRFAHPTGYVGRLGGALDCHSACPGPNQRA